MEGSRTSYIQMKKDTGQEREAAVAAAAAAAAGGENMHDEKEAHQPCTDFTGLRAPEEAGKVGLK